MAKKQKVTPKKGTEVLEDPQVLAEQFSKTEEFINKHKVAFLAILGGVAAIIIGVFTYNYYTRKQNEIAQSELFQAVYYFEADSLGKALNGDGNNLGFLDIIDEYSNTKAANIAEFYVGVSYLKMGEFQEAIVYLEAFEADDLLLQARAYALTGDAYMELGNYYDALEFYNKAADYKPNPYLTPQYLMKAAIAYEKVEEYEEALKRYSKIVENYQESAEYQDALKHKARLETKIS